MKKNDFFKILSYAEVVSFGRNQRNRNVNDKHVNDFMNIIRDGKFAIHNDDGTYFPFGAAPIIVNPKSVEFDENGEIHILDGQHKNEAFVKAYEKGMIDDNARILVSYWPIEDPELENELTIMLNTNTKAWSMEDYMTSYSKYIDSYAKLKKFCLSHELCHGYSKSGKEQYKYRTAAAILTGKNSRSILRKGAFTFSKEQEELGNTIHDELKAIREFLEMPMVGADIEAMAIEWHTQRNFVTVKDITKLGYIQGAIRNLVSGTPNQLAWKQVFSLLKDAVQKKNLKRAA